MNEMSYSAALAKYPAIDETYLNALLEECIRKDPSKIIVLDDDPTGVQTVHDISVFTNWKTETIRRAFAESQKVFYVLTNSRGMTAEETTAVHYEIAQTIAMIAEESKKPYFFISRSDSTLRGHYPLETKILREEAIKSGNAPDGEILVPFFKEGGRFTIDNVHYVKYDDTLVPAAETEFAKDVTFGYTHSDLPGYIEEKTCGEFKAEEVVCISLEELRKMDFDGISEKLRRTHDFGKVIVNALDYCDIKVFAIALYRTMEEGKRFMFRSAAGLVKVLGGISGRPLLTREEMIRKDTKNGGIVVVGSHTNKTTAQLNALLTLPQVEPIPFHSELVLEGEKVFEKEIQRCVARAEEVILEGRTAVCFTNRKLLKIEGDTKEEALRRSVRISDGVQRLVAELHVEPAFVMAKGGITSSDVGIKALRVERANVMGQICLSVPVWQTGPESRFPLMPYIIFPGNTGDENTLKEAVEILSK